MGQVHARAWTRLAQHFPQVPVRPRFVAVADTDEHRRREAADVYGFAHVESDWRAVLERGDVDVVSVCGPNFVHREIGAAVAESGRHLWIEKPAGRGAGGTAAIAPAGRKSGVMSAVGVNYRNAPPVEGARGLGGAGRPRGGGAGEGGL